MFGLRPRKPFMVTIELHMDMNIAKEVPPEQLEADIKAMLEEKAAEVTKAVKKELEKRKYR